MEKNVPVVKVKKGDSVVIVNTTDVEKWKADGYTVESDSTKADVKGGKEGTGGQSGSKDPKISGGPSK